MKNFFALLVAASLLASPNLLRAADGESIKGMRLEPATTRVAVIGKARLSVEPLVRGGDGLRAPYKVDVSGLPTGSEQGKFAITLSGADFDKLASGKSFNFSGEAVNTAGDKSVVHGTANPSSADAGSIKVKVESKKGKLVFNTTYLITR